MYQASRLRLSIIHYASTTQRENHQFKSTMLALSRFARITKKIAVVHPTTTTAQRRSVATASSNATYNTLQEEIDDANQRYQGKLQIRETSDRGYGLVSSRLFQKGEKVMSSHAICISHCRDSHSVQMAWDQHANIDLPARFVNHSCDANLGIKNNYSDDTGVYDFYALKDIDEGKELLWDYETSEYEIGSFDNCLCGSPKCRVSMGGFKKNGDKVKKMYGDHIADYLKER